MALGLDRDLQTRVPDYTRALQGLEESAAAQSELDELVGHGTRVEESRLADYGQAPDFRGISLWLNSGAADLAELRGKVVVLDFWTYSCVNCLRTLPHVKSLVRGVP